MIKEASHNMKSKIFCLILIFLIISCSSWTSQEKEEIIHFKKAQALFLEAERYLKNITRGDAVVGTITDKERNTYISKLTEALDEASKVSENVLRKIHPKLPEAYRSIFIPCLQKRLNGFQNHDLTATIEGATLHNVWIDWWNAHYKEFAKV